LIVTICQFYFRFTKELSLQLFEARKESSTDSTNVQIEVQDSWMVLSEIRPNLNDDEEESIENDDK
jgi:hypothetical protein